jgi:phosphoserine aminotransferase
MSVLEMSHRGKDFMSIAQQAEADLRELLAIPSNYKVLFLQGGASSQFAMVPQNLLRDKATAAYICTGSWSKKAFAEGKRLCNAHLAATTEASKFTTVPDAASLNFAPDAAFVHYTPNETIEGVEFPYIPDTGDIPLVADMSSTLLSRPVDVSRFGLIYAGAQKNMGPAGLAVVIIREELLGQAMPNTPTMFNYKIHADNESMYNTPPTYSWYLAGLVFQWLKRNGGLEAMAVINQRKAAALYAAIDNSGFYKNPVNPQCRSWMNVPFVLPDPSLDASFLDKAKQAGLVTLKGHRSVGGMRASIYNAMPEQGVQALIEFMAEFQRQYS